MKVKFFYLLSTLFFILVLIVSFKTVGNSKTARYENSNQSGFQVENHFRQLLQNSPAIIEDVNGNRISLNELQITRQWNGNVCKITLKNIGKQSKSPSNIVVFNISNHGLNPESVLYGEGFQMLHQNGGNLTKLENIGNYADNKHYNIPEPHGMPTAYGVLVISPKPDSHLLLGFSSCKRFIGRISYDSIQIKISQDAEGIELKPGETWVMEDFIILSGKDRGKLFDQLTTEIQRNHPPIKRKTIPTGWCSWYCYGPAVTHDIIENNLNRFSAILPELKFIQLDDGYQPFMGDWLDENPTYGNLNKTISAIRNKGFEPAIWVAPFIAEKNSRVFKEHPNWFVKDIDGNPLNSSKIGFGGWRSGPWYVLDGTHPEVQNHLEYVFREMREKWGVNYFKLDANYWGAIHGGVHYDKSATRVEAYRRGMEAVLKGCNDNSVVLGCNAPIWPSLGLVTAMRTSNDVNRDWPTIKSTAYENLCRAWQNGKFWDADPDCVLLANDTLFSGKIAISKKEWMFHATAIHAVGGLILTGDKASNLTKTELLILKKLLHPTGKGARFTDGKMEIGITDIGKIKYYYFFNWSETETIDLKIKLFDKSYLTDYWTNEKLGIFEGTYTVRQLAPHSARLIMATK